MPGGSLCRRIDQVFFANTPVWPVTGVISFRSVITVINCLLDT